MADGSFLVVTSVEAECGYNGGDYFLGNDKVR